MNRRGFLKFLSVAPVAVPIAASSVAAAPVSSADALPAFAIEPGEKLEIIGLSRHELFGPAEIRTLIEKINDAQRDGYKISFDHDLSAPPIRMRGAA